ncbi:O-antigen ligase family protein [uncultured Winogradskyella sp.]|uniref:O-antigen ligase family protein n=1 Tax=uncultured Winogradskyella sp. TaxID=395353 RepID=UPI0030EEC117|tara:strand:- start:1567 stop:2739 length:1173 start_codon:yes stop_codon:yes gene_type:complete
MFKALSKHHDLSTLVNVLLFSSLGLIYFSFALSNIVLGLAIAMVIYSILFKKIELNLNKHNFVFYTFLITPFLLTLISVFNSENSSVGFKYLWLRLPILIIPFIFQFTKVEKQSLIAGLKVFTAFSIVAVLKTLYNALIYRNEDILFDPDFIFFITIIQHPYFGVFVLIVLVSIIEFDMIKYKYLKISLFILFTVAIALATSRLVYLLFALIIVFYLIKRFSIKKALVIAALLSLISVLFLNKNIIAKFQTSVQYENSPRLKLWNNAYKVVNSEGDMSFGMGIGDYYKIKKDPYFFEDNSNGIKGYNPHSQIAEFFVTNGYFGLIVLSICFIFGIKEIRKQNTFAMITFVIIVSFAFTECILTRQFGVQLYSIFMPLVFMTNFRRTNNET